MTRLAEFGQKPQVDELLAGDTRISPHLDYPRTFTRREFLKLSAVGFGGLLAGCQPPPDITPSPSLPSTPTSTFPTYSSNTPSAVASERASTPEPSATPDRVASFEIPADHAPFWAFDGKISKLLTTQDGRDFALYGAFFQPYLINQRVEKIGAHDVVVATAVYLSTDGVKREVDVVLEPQFLKYFDWGTGIPAPSPLDKGIGEETIPLDEIQRDLKTWITEKRQIPLYVEIGYGGIPSNIKNRDCDATCGVVDDVLLQINPDDLLEFYRTGGATHEGVTNIRILVSFVAVGETNLRQKGEISPWPADQIRQFPFKP